MTRIFSIIGIAIGILLIIMGIATSIPSDTIETGTLAQNNRERGGYQRYVGGDAYNFIIESSIRGGEISGGTAARAVYIGSGAIILSGSLIVLGTILDKEKAVKRPEDASFPSENVVADGEPPNDNGDESAK